MEVYSMNANARRFLALNCAINGRGIIPAYDNDVYKASKELNISSSEVLELNSKLLELNSKSMMFDELDRLVKILINFIRCPWYSFIFVPEMGKVNIVDLMEMDRNGSVDKNIIKMTLDQIIQNAVKINNEGDCRIADGCLYVTRGQADVFRQSFTKAYEIAKNGFETKLTKKSIFSNRKYFDIKMYSEISVNVFLNIVKTLISNDINVSDYRYTLLRVADMFTVYEKIGCVQAYDAEEDIIDWIISNEDDSKSKLFRVHSNGVISFIVNSMKDLMNVRYNSRTGELFIC